MIAICLCIIIANLHFIPGAQATSGVWYENSNIPYQVFNVSCSGTEENLLDCQYSTTSSSSCGTLGHATVFCQRGI